MVGTLYVRKEKLPFLKRTPKTIVYRDRRYFMDDDMFTMKKAREKAKKYTSVGIDVLLVKTRGVPGATIYLLGYEHRSGRKI